MSLAADGRPKPPFKNPADVPTQLGRPFPEYVAGYMFEVLLYGINLMLFAVAVYILVWRTKASSRWALLISAVLMFSLATANVGISQYVLFGVVIHGTPLQLSLNRARHLFLVFNTIIADMLLIYRCYSVWGHSKLVIIGPSIFLTGSAIAGLIFMSQPVMKVGWRKFVYFWLSLFFNVSMTTLMAIRIWWMGHRAQTVLGRSMARKYYPAMALIIETGAIYSLYVLIDQIVVAVGARSFVIDAGLTQAVVIAPTLIIVQVGLGRHIRDLQTTIRLTRNEHSILLSTVPTVQTA